MSAPLRLGGFKLLSFDCYGTLIDWEQGIVTALSELRRRLAEPIGEALLLEHYAEAESLQQEATPALAYRELLELVYRRLERGFGLGASAAQAQRFAASVPDWPAFADSAAALARLNRCCRLVILSNVDEVSFHGSQARLGVVFDAVYTAERIGSYKPALRNFEYLIEQVQADFGIAAHQILHVAQSLYHDHVPANRIGLASAFIDRRYAKPGQGATRAPATAVHFDFRFTSLAALAEAFESDRAALDART